MQLNCLSLADFSLINFLYALFATFHLERVIREMDYSNIFCIKLNGQSLLELHTATKKNIPVR